MYFGNTRLHLSAHGVAKVSSPSRRRAVAVETTGTMSSTALITGACGFVARHLADRLAAAGHSVAGIDMWSSCEIADIRYFQTGILDTTALVSILSETRPDQVYHLAGVSYLPDADATPRAALETNIVGTISVLDAVRIACPSSRVLVVGSSKEYGITSHDCVPESAPTTPTDFYGISKLCAELVGRQYSRHYNMDVRFTRSFNHTGPGQAPRFVCSEWARKAAQIHQGAEEPFVSVGDVSYEIDFLDVRDVASAYALILDKGVSGEVYNVCSGATVALSWILEYLLAKCGREVRVERADAKLRAHATSPRLAGDNSLLARRTGWQRAIPLEKTLDDLFDYWCARPGK